MPDPTAREALEDFRCWLVETCDHIRNTGEWLGTTHGPGDIMLFERSNGLRLAIDEVEQRIDALMDSKAAGAYDANGNPRTTPVRTSLPASLCPNIGGEPLDDEFTEYEFDILYGADGKENVPSGAIQREPIPDILKGLVQWEHTDRLRYWATKKRTKEGDDVLEAAIEGAARAAAIITARRDGVWDVGNDPHPPLDDPNPESDTP